VLCARKFQILKELDETVRNIRKATQKTNPNFVTDNGELKKWVAINKAQNFDAELIELLLESTELKEKFFVEVKGTLVLTKTCLCSFWSRKIT